MLLFGILFLASDPVSGPNNKWGARCSTAWGVALGVMCFRYVGALETDLCFVLLLASPLSKEFDRLGGRLSHRIARWAQREKGGKIMLKALYQQHRQGFRDYDNILTRNTVLVQGLCIAPVVVAATTLKNACLLGLAFAAITFVSVVLLSFLPKKTPFTLPCHCRGAAWPAGCLSPPPFGCGTCFPETSSRWASSCLCW